MRVARGPPSASLLTPGQLVPQRHHREGPCTERQEAPVAPRFPEGTHTQWMHSTRGPPGSPGSSGKPLEPDGAGPHPSEPRVAAHGVQCSAERGPVAAPKDRLSTGWSPQGLALMPVQAGVAARVEGRGLGQVEPQAALQLQAPAGCLGLNRPWKFRVRLVPPRKQG